MLRPSPFQRACRRAIAAVILVVTWTTMGLALEHQASSAHSYCAEHGAVEERGGAAAASESGGPAIAGEEAEAHEECAFAEALPVGSTPGRGRDWGIGLEPIAGRPLGVGAPPAASFPLLSLAPKTSPPRG